MLLKHEFGNEFVINLVHSQCGQTSAHKDVHVCFFDTDMILYIPHHWLKKEKFFREEDQELVIVNIVVNSFNLILEN